MTNCQNKEASQKSIKCMEKILKYSQTWALLSEVDDLAIEECTTEETLERYKSKNSQQINPYLVWLPHQWQDVYNVC